MGRRGALLIQSIADGIKRLDAVDSVTLPDATMDATDRIHSSRRKIGETLVRLQQLRESQGTRH